MSSLSVTGAVGERRRTHGQSPRVLRRDVRPALAFGTLGRKYMLTPRPLEHLQVIVGELDAGGSTGDEPYTHGDSEELLSLIHI